MKTDIRTKLARGLISLGILTSSVAIADACMYMAKQGRFKDPEGYVIAQRTEEGQKGEKRYLGLMGLGLAISIAGLAYDPSHGGRKQQPESE